MKKILLSFALVMMVVFTFGQGFEGLRVDKFVPTAAAIAADPNLNANSVTYRVFVDMAPGYKLSDVIGSTQNPVYFKTTTQLYNEGNDGDIIPRYRPRPTVNDPLFYDSWLTIGEYGKQAEASQLVPLSEDTDGTPDGVLLGAAPIATALDPATNFGLFFSYLMASSADGTTAGWDPENVIWYAAGGQAGVGASNSVCIGQFTTDGNFEMELGVNIVHPTLPAVRYVYRTSLGAGIEVDNRLYYTSVESNIAPVATFTNPLNGNDVYSNRDITVTIDATDANLAPALQAIKNVEFRVDGGAPVVDVTAPFSFTWNTGAERNGVVLEARATNVAGDLVGAWSAITIDVVREIIAPTVSISADDNEVVEGQVINFTAVKTDGSSPVTNVDFKVDGISVQSGFSTSFAWTSNVVGPAVPVSVTVTSIDGTATASMTVKVISGAASYEILSQSVNCNVSDRMCIPFRKIGAALTDVTGFDFTVTYDVAKVMPTGQVDVYNNAGGANNDNTGYTINDLGNGTMYVSIYLDGNSLTTDGWDGTDVNLFCIEFAKKGSFLPTDLVTFGASNIIESKVSGISDPKVASAGTFATFTNTIYEGFVKFWGDNQPIAGANEVKTIIDGAGIDDTTDVNGYFQYDFTTGVDMDMVIKKQVSNSASPLVLPSVYSGYDAYLTAKVLVNDLTFLPDAYQVVAMDVNRDGKVSAGDISQINQRTVKAIDEFTTSAGSSYDWVFVNETSLFNDNSYTRSATYPDDDLAGFSKARVPAVTDTFNLNDFVANSTTCPVIISGNNTYYGVALGDVDGSWANAAVDNKLKSAAADAVIFDLSNAYYEEDYLDIPLLVRAESEVNSVDFVIEYNTSKLSFENVINRTEYINLLSNASEQYVSLTSYSLTDYEVGKPLMFVRFYAPQGFDAQDILATASYINGVKVGTVLSSALNVGQYDANVRVFPNPATELVTVTASEVVNIQMVDLQGKVLFEKANVNGKQEIDVRSMSNGVYMVKVSNNNFTSVKRIVIQK